MDTSTALTNDSGTHLVSTKKRARRPSKKVSSAVRLVTKPKTVSAGKAVGGALLGSFVPLAAHTLVNAPEFGSVDHILWIVIACLAYSAPTVCGWAGQFTTAGAKHWASHTLGWAKAIGFVGCLEGILVAAPASCSWLSWIALAMLMGINSTILALKFGKKA